MRIEALRQGALPRPRLDDLAPRSAAGLILAVEEDVVHGAALRDVLQGAGHELWICQDPRRFAGDLNIPKQGAADWSRDELVAVLNAAGDVVRGGGK